MATDNACLVCGIVYGCSLTATVSIDGHPLMIEPFCCESHRDEATAWPADRVLRAVFGSPEWGRYLLHLQSTGRLHAEDIPCSPPCGV